MKGKDTRREKRSSYTNVVKEFNYSVERMKAEGSTEADNLEPLSEDYVKDAQTVMRTEIDTRLPSIRGSMRMRKALQKHGPELYGVMDVVESRFPLLAQARLRWVSRAMMRNICSSSQEA